MRLLVVVTEEGERGNIDKTNFQKGLLTEEKTAAVDEMQNLIQDNNITLFPQR